MRNDLLMCNMGISFVAFLFTETIILLSKDKNYLLEMNDKIQTNQSTQLQILNLT
jgi:hypothetical protein